MNKIKTQCTSGKKYVIHIFINKNYLKKISGESANLLFNHNNVNHGINKVLSQ